MPTCFAILASECVGTLSEREDALREDTVGTILDQQDPQTGWFTDGPVLPRDTSSHSPEYIGMQHTYFAIHALDALGLRPRYPIEFADRLKSIPYLRGWLDGGPWNNPWLHSNNIMFAACFLQLAHETTGNEDYLGALDAILDYLDERQDPISGLWQRDGGRDDRNAVFAAYHWFPLYFWRGRRPAYVERIIDTTLGIQADDGFYLPGGGACEDLDAVHTLVMMTAVTDYRRSDVGKSLLRCGEAILASQLPDGGFRNYRRRRGGLVRRAVRITNADRLLLKRDLLGRSWRYSGWKPLSCPTDASDVWSAWFRPLALRLIYGDCLDSGVYRSLPGLGWHNAERIATAEPRPQGPAAA